MSTHLFLSRPRIFRTFLAAFALAAIAPGLAADAYAQTETDIAFFSTSITYAGITFDSAGNAYGMTYNGGNSPNCGGVGSGCGTVFELSPAGGTAWTQTTIHNFQDHADGALPLAGLTVDTAGNLYGTNFGSYTEGGTSHGGVAFELSHASGNSWTFTSLYAFDQTKETVPPSSPLTIDAAGNLYGVTYFGGRYSNGSVFELSKTGERWKETILHSFGGPGDGSLPYGPLVIDSEGNLYGTTSAGGSAGSGTAYELSRQTSGAWKETLLHTFVGARSHQAGLILDSAHNLYGTTFGGGAYGYGVVFRLTRVKQNGKVAWKYVPLYSFTNGADGGAPASPLTFDAAGNLYGTDGADPNSCQGFYGCWQVYKLSVGSNGLWQIAALYPIPNQNDPGNVSLVLDSSGDIFGTAYDNHYFSDAEVYEVTQ
jgi:uncharacterized repeat protein (TIGR03803 family)